MTVRQGRRLNKLLDNLKERRGYWKLKGEAPDRNREQLALEEDMDLS
jgi:hypothetical protein